MTAIRRASRTRDFSRATLLVLLQVTNHLFKKVGAKFGMDLVSFNMQRGREFGIPSYMQFR